MVYPGIIDRGLVNDGCGNEMMVSQPLLIDNENDGPKAALILAAGKMERGAYYHNCLRKVSLPENDPAKNASLGLEMRESAERNNSTVFVC